ncbi:MAG: CCA tRNA nucleotidyltransferase [Hyphomicrobiaceae bacterium]
MTRLPNISDAPWLAAAGTQSVFATVRAGGFGARAVGGAVRNTLMGRPVSDVDLATNARPEDVARLAKAAGLKVYETGLQHGTVTVIADNMPIEVTTLREDVETDGRHATVAFTDDWGADAARRDFTINALYCDADGTIFDPLDGFPDISAQRVRFIGNAGDRIREDYLRILRFFRLSACFGDGTLDTDGLAAVIRARDGLARISAERISAELLKTLVAPHAAGVVSAMAETGILSSVLATAPRTTRLKRLLQLEAGGPHDAIRCLAALAVFTPDDGPRLARRLRLGNDERDRLSVMGGLYAFAPATPDDARKALYRLGREAFDDLVVLRAAEAADPSLAQTLLDQVRAWPVPEFPVSGADLIARGCEPGPNLGNMLKTMEERWIGSDFSFSKAQLIDQAMQDDNDD